MRNGRDEMMPSNTKMIAVAIGGMIGVALLLYPIFCLFAQADATMLPLRDSSADLVMGSPPYADARLYLENDDSPGLTRRSSSRTKPTTTCHCFRNPDHPWRPTCDD